MIPRSSVSGVHWPALPDGAGALMLALQEQFARSERLARDEIERRQLAVLATLLRHAVETVPYYRAAPAYGEFAGRSVLTPEDWRSLPILSRAAIQEAGDALRSDNVPADHLPLVEALTTGSTGRPVRGLATRVTGLFWVAVTLREVMWHDRDLSGKLAAMRADPSDLIPAEGAKLPNWEPTVATAYDTGPCVTMSIKHDVRTQAEWLAAAEPDYVLSYPSNLVAVAEHLRDTGVKLTNLREVITYGETLTAETRSALREGWGVPVVDMYSAQELGYIALQCPETEEYHVQSEVVYVEVLDDAGSPCAPGEVGRVVVTALHNHAMPMLRYEIGDYAQLGERDCPCGRTLPLLKRIMGRQRNIWTLPNGERVWPMFTSRKWGHIDAIRQLQLVQHDLDRIEAKIVGPRPLTAEEEDELTALLREEFDFPFELTLTRLPEIDRSEGMKFEDFVSLVPAPNAR